MNLGPFQDIPTSDSDGFDDFKFNLQVNHDTIAQRMFALNLVYKTYPLVDSLRHTKDWQQNLQQELGSIFSLLGMSGLPDFASVDLDREEDFHDFLQQLVFVERRINATLGIF